VSNRALVPQSQFCWAGILKQLSAFGHASFDAKVRGQPVTDPHYDWQNFFAQMLPAYQANLTQAIANVHAAAEGDPYAMYGGYRIIAEFEPTTEDPLYFDMMDADLKLPLSNTRPTSASPPASP
jgi:hypothetical protein